MRWLSGYLAMAVGVLVTICVQSSSITTSALTPLVGVGVITVDRMYPTVLGANIGTCITGMLAALAADSSKLYLTLQVAYPPSYPPPTLLLLSLPLLPPLPL